MIFTSKLACPVCGQQLFQKEKSLFCQSGHCFDLAKEGYVNLLTGTHKNGSLIGDNKSMALSRQDFLNKGYFSCLSEALSFYISAFGKDHPTMLDICCGEGYYSEKILQKIDCELYGFDISREMVRLAAKRKLSASFFVANLSHIPMKSGCADIVFHLFAPFHEKEFSRVLNEDGILITVVPGKNHLFELKKAIYENPYKNDEKLPCVSSLSLFESFRISDKITLKSTEDIMNLFKMTPYYYRTGETDKAKLENLVTLETEIEFVFGVYKK